MKTIHHVLDVDAGRDSVWSALTEADRMAAWWSTMVRTPTAAVGVRVEWTFSGDFNPVMEITKLEEGRELEWRCVGGHEPVARQHLSFRTRRSRRRPHPAPFLAGLCGRTQRRRLRRLQLQLGLRHGEPAPFVCHRDPERTFSAAHKPKGTVVDQTRLTETSQYTARREALRRAEVDLMRRREQVAEMRRQLPEGSPVDDYMFQEGPPRLEDGDAAVTTVRLSDLFSAPERSLVVYHLMLGKKQTSPCPMCTLWIDGFDGVARHLDQNVEFAVAAAADLPTLRAHARARGWNRLRLLSCADNTFKFDLGSEDASGAQDSAISVFTLDAGGSPRHFYTAHPRMDDDIDQRGIDLLAPVWHVLDLTPRGRGDWYANLDYGR